MAAQTAEKLVAADAELIRLAARVTYGANRQTLEAAESLGYEGFLDWQLDYESIDDGGLESLLADRLPTLTMDAAELAAFLREQENANLAQREMAIATIVRKAFSPCQLYERMVEFWTDHFNVAVSNAALAFLKPLEDREVIRPLAMGRFEPLLQADAKSPAMLYYLDNFNNTAAGPNENYARELMELHTLGAGGGYDENDVKEAARVFTGWTIRRPADFAFNPLAHDWGEKQILSLHLPAGGGVSDGEQLLAFLAGHESTASHLATKLSRRFVSDQPGLGLVERVAEAFLASGGDIRVMLRAVLLDSEVRQAAPAKLKRPNEFLAGALRGLEVTPGAVVVREIFESLQAAGHLPFQWPAPNGYPDIRGYWQSSTGFLMRFNTALEWSARFSARSALLAEAGSIRGIGRQVDFLADALVPTGISPEARGVLVTQATSVPADQRPATIAALLLAGPDFQWR